MAISDAELAKRQEHWAREDATTAFERQRQLDQEAYDRSIDYSKQIEQLKAAGLSPYMLDPGLGGMAASGSSAPKADTASMPYGSQARSTANLINLGSAAVDTAMKIAQIKNINADTTNKENTTPTPDQFNSMFSARIDNLFADSNSKNATARLAGVRSAAESYDLSFNQAMEDTRKDTLQVSRDNAVALGDKLRAEITQLAKTGNLTEAKSRQINAELGLIELRKALMTSQVNATNANARFTRAQAQTVENFYNNVASNPEYYTAVRKQPAYQNASTEAKTALDRFAQEVNDVIGVKGTAGNIEFKTLTDGNMVKSAYGLMHLLANSGEFNRKYSE